MLNKTNPLTYKANVSKNQKKKLLLHFGPSASARILRNGEKNIPSQQLFLDGPNLFDSIFAGVVWIDKLYDCDRIIFWQQKQEKATF